jgi:hypothetical protein
VCIHCFIVDSDNEDFGFGIDEEIDGDELIRFTQDMNAKKHDCIPSRTKKITTERSIVKRPSSKKKSGNKLKFIWKKIVFKLKKINYIQIPTGPWNDFSYFMSSTIFKTIKMIDHIIER